jgi:O-antigen ligase
VGFAANTATGSACFNCLNSFTIIEQPPPFLAMIRKSIVIAIKFGAVALLFIMLLFADEVLVSSSGFVGSALREIVAVLRDRETQWMVFLCLGTYFTAFLFLRARVETDKRKGAKASWWLVYVLLISAALYTIDYSPSTLALTLLGGAVLGQGAAAWACFEVRSQKSEVRSDFRFRAVSILVVLLALASISQTDAGHIFEYHGHARWSGPWDNPNIFGLLMGTGAALAVGIGMRGWRMEDGRWKTRSGVWRLVFGKFAVVTLCLIAVCLMGRGLSHSYSRGAWLATFCGMSYLGYQVFRCQVSSSSKSEIGNRKSETLRSLCSLWLRKNQLPLSVILVSVFVLVFWHFRQTAWHPARRAFSVVNAGDFSWRNRIAAWEGALQMMVEHPWFGFGWNQPEPLYEHYYLLPKLSESAAIQMNDYLLLGATLGIPALFCFGIYLSLSLFRNSAFSLQPLELLPATCRAGAIVLLVGFWFDGGLFKLPTAATFWILLELGSAGNREICEPHEND